MNGNPVIDVRGMTKRFGELTAVDHVDLRVGAGEIYGFLGPNGSGKTTFLRMLCGLLRADDGSGKVLDYDVIAESEAIKREVGYMTQRFSFWEDLTIEENLDFVARMYELKNRRAIVKESLTQLGLADRRNQLAGQLSGGWKQRLALAACLIHKPKLLLLDEPTAGVDPKARRDFWEEIHRLAGKGLTFLITTHYMDEAERCGRVGYMHLSKLLIVGTPAELKSLPEVTPPGFRRVEIASPDVAELLASLRHRTTVREPTIFGESIHALVDERDSLADIAGPGISIRPAAANLEDVFVTIARKRTEELAQAG
jgi:ABC-type multidrug transport system ATPase subunit